MPKSVHAVVGEIDRRLAAAAPDGTPEWITAANLRHLASEYLNNRDDQVARSPALAGRAHWNLWMKDARLDDAAFAVLLFRTDAVEFFCGSGNSLQVRLMSENEPLDDPHTVYDLMRQRFAVDGEPLRLDRRAAEAWLGRPRTW